MSRKNKKDDELDTETTFADMNVEGFRWYNGSKKTKPNEKLVKQKISRREYWRMVRGAFVSFLPYFAVFLLFMGSLVGLAYLWLS